MKKQFSILIFILSLVLVVVSIFIYKSASDIKTYNTSLLNRMNRNDSSSLVMVKYLDLNNNELLEEIKISQEKTVKQQWAECPAGCYGTKLFINLAQYENGKWDNIIENYKFGERVYYPYAESDLYISIGDVTNDEIDDLVISMNRGSEFATSSIILGFTGENIGIIKHFELMGDILYIKDNILFGRWYSDKLFGDSNEVRKYTWNGKDFIISNL